MADININEVYEELKYLGDLPETSRLIKDYLALREEDATLRALVNGLAEVVSLTRPKFCNGCPGALCSIVGEPCGFVSQADELVARAKEVTK